MRSMIEKIASRTGIEPSVVRRVVEEFCLDLRRGLDEYDEHNRDYIGEQLHWEISNRAYFHLLGFLDTFSEKYQWEPHSASEYVSRLFSKEEWTPFSEEYLRADAPQREAFSASENDAIDEFGLAARACAMSLMGNADYVQNELPNVDLPADMRALVESLCADLIGTKHDVVHELDDLKECSDVKGRVRRIMNLLSEDMVKLNEHVRKLEYLAKADERFQLAYLLVGESGANILRSFVAAGQAADRVLEED